MSDIQPGVLFQILCLTELGVMEIGIIQLTPHIKANALATLRRTGWKRVGCVDSLTHFQA